MRVLEMSKCQTLLSKIAKLVGTWIDFVNLGRRVDCTESSDAAG